MKVEDFRDSIESLRFVGSGYAYVIDLEGTAVIHPVLPRGTNIPGSSPAGETAFLEEMLEKRRDEIFAPAETLRSQALLVALLCLGVGAAVAVRISKSITRPIRSLTTRLSGEETAGNPGDGAAARDEVRQLATHFDHFLAELERESGERRAVEKRLRSSEERYRALMASAPARCWWTSP